MSFESFNNHTENPKVSCLMVTANRRQLMKRSVHCFLKQDYINKELVVVDDGEQDLSPVLSKIPASQLLYFKLNPSKKNNLGELRNFTIQNAGGDVLMQWDDDDWFHPTCISIQVETLLNGFDACCLSGTIIHVNTPEYARHPYIGFLADGFPGSIMHRKDKTMTYPPRARGEDTAFLRQWKQKRYKKLAREFAYLYIYSFHGSNTWEKKHFIRRIRNSPIRLLQYVWYGKIKGNLIKHPLFSLTQKEQESFKMYMEDSIAFDLI